MSTTDDAVKKITETIDEVKKKAGPAIDEVKKKAGPVIDEVKKKAGPAVDGVKKKTAPAVDEVKKRAVPAAESVKKQAGKAAGQAKKAGKTITEKVAEVTAKSEVFVQYGDYEIKTEDIVTRAREAYVAEGHKASDIHEIQIYIKPSDNCAYYVINHRDTGKVEF